MTARGTVRILRIGLALVLAATAAGKLLDLPGFARVLGTYQVLADSAWLPAAAAISAVEGGLAVWLASGRRVALAGAVACLLHLLYAAWSAAAIARGLSLPNCGCFGVFLARPLTGITVAEDLVLAALSFAVWRLASRRPVEA